MHGFCKTLGAFLPLRVFAESAQQNGERAGERCIVFTLILFSQFLRIFLIPITRTVEAIKFAGIVYSGESI
jgi:hypothetical protein